MFNQKTAGYGGPNKVEKAKVGLIQFCISPPKTDMENQVGILKMVLGDDSGLFCWLTMVLVE